MPSFYRKYWQPIFSHFARYDSDPRLRTSVDSNQPQPTSPRPLGLFELSRGLALDRGPAFSPAQLSIGRRLMERGEMAASGSQDSLPFAEEDASLVDSPDCDLSKNALIRKNPETLGFVIQFDLIRFSILSWLNLFNFILSFIRNTGQSYCEVQTVQQSRPAAVLASIEDLSLSIDSQHTHLDITSQLGTQVWHGFSLHNFWVCILYTFTTVEPGSDPAQEVLCFIYTVYCLKNSACGSIIYRLFNKPNYRGY